MVAVVGALGTAGGAAIGVLAGPGGAAAGGFIGGFVGAIIGAKLAEFVLDNLGLTKPEIKHRAQDFADLLGDGHPLLTAAEPVSGKVLMDALLGRVSADIRLAANEAADDATLPPPTYMEDYFVEVHVYQNQRYW
jgi:hypothetical protein